jgi:putative ABC transport system permease protein
MSELSSDLRYAFRLIRKTPGFSAVAILTLALGIGANTAIFSVVDAVLLRPLPFADGDRLVMLFHSYPKMDLDLASVSPPGFVDYRDHTRSFAGMAAHTGYRTPAALTGQGEPRRLRIEAASAGFFTTLGVTPALGRGFLPEDEQPGRGEVAVLSQGLWQQLFGSDPGVLDRPITLDGRAYTIVGVAPEGFRYPNETDLWIPLGFKPEQLVDEERGREYLTVVARLAPGVSLPTARSEMAGVSRGIRDRARSRTTFLDSADWHVRVEPLRDSLVGDVRPALLVLLAAVGAVLLIACVNVANLLLARAAVRAREMALRTALGAGRGRMIRQLLVESVLLALLGGGLGVLLAAWGIQALVAARPTQIPSDLPITLDLRVLAFTCLLSLLTGLLFGLLPALRTSRPNLQRELQHGGRGDAGGRGRLRGVLVVAEVALALVLLVGAGLLLQSFAHRLRVDTGFTTRGLLTFQLSLPAAEYADDARVAGFYRALGERLAALPGVQAVGAVSTLPLSGGMSTASYRFENQPLQPGDSGPHGAPRIVTPDYFRTLGIPLRKGRLLTPQDGADAVPVAVIDEAVARRYFPGRNPLGERLSFGFEDGGDGGDTPHWRTIVGVVGHVQEQTPGEEGKSQVYLPHAQRSERDLWVALAAGNDPLSLAGPVRETVRSLDPKIPVDELRTMEERLSRAVAQPRLSALLLGLFAALAATLAAIGLYGVMAYAVAQRQREIGVRLALGARPGQVLRMVVGQGAGLTALGLLLGLAGALALSHLVTGLLFEIEPTDPATLFGVTLLLAGAALLASYLPARRAAKLDPQVALRGE